MKKVLVICGPTATGKTAFAREVASWCNGELISADSRQVYRGMDIGTGKDRSTDRIWLYDVVDPDQDFSVSHFVPLAEKAIQDIHARNKLPIIVGGTGLYIKALVEGIATVSIPRNDTLRHELISISVGQLQQLLSKIDPNQLSMMNNSDKHNPRRLIRKIEIATFSKQQPTVERVPYDWLQIGLSILEEAQEEKITQRVLKRVSEGIVDEVRSLINNGYTFELPAMDTFGYKEWKEYLKSPTNQNKERAIQQWTQHELQYVKRQKTWFTKQKNISWYLPNNLPQALSTIRLWYTLP